MWDDARYASYRGFEGAPFGWGGAHNTHYAWLGRQHAEGAVLGFEVQVCTASPCGSSEEGLPSREKRADRPRPAPRPARGARDDGDHDQLRGGEH